MTVREYRPVPHDHKGFLARMSERQGFDSAYDSLEDEYKLAREFLAARIEAGLTQEDVAVSMKTSKSAVSRLESGRRQSPSISTLRKYAEAVGCEINIRLVKKEARLGSETGNRQDEDW